MNDTIMALLFNPISCVVWFYLIVGLWSYWDSKKSQKKA